MSERQEEQPTRKVCDNSSQQGPPCTEQRTRNVSEPDAHLLSYFDVYVAVYLRGRVQEAVVLEQRDEIGVAIRRTGDLIAAHHADSVGIAEGKVCMALADLRIVCTQSVPSTKTAPLYRFSKLGRNAFKRRTRPRFARACSSGSARGEAALSMKITEREKRCNCA